MTPRQIELVEAVVKADGNYTEAADALSCTPANVSMTMTRAARLAGLTPGGRTREAHRNLAEHLLARTVALVLVEPPRVEGGPTLPATCHPDRESYQLRVCRECYAERVRRSRESFGHGPRSAVQKLIDRQLAGDGFHQPRQSRDLPGEPLTAAQRQILHALADGSTAKAAANRLGISVQTVKNHLTSCYVRLDVAGGLVEAYLKLGWLRPPDDPLTPTSEDLVVDHQLALLQVESLIERLRALVEAAKA